MALSGRDDRIEAAIEGEISGQIAVGKYITQLHVEAGAIVNWHAVGQQPNIRPRPRPVRQLPRASRGLLDRQNECETALRELRLSAPVELHGRAGVGKTSILRLLANRPDAPFTEQALIYLYARGQLRMDVLQVIFDALYETDCPFRLTESDARRYLAGTQALIILDDLDLPREECVALVDEAPTLTFLIASEERHLWEEGRGIAVRGLAHEFAVALLERHMELGRALTTEELSTAHELSALLEGHPLSILRLAALVREADHSLADLMASLTTHGPPEAVVTQLVVESLSAQEKRILGLLAVLAGLSIHRDHVAGALGVRDASAGLQVLERRGLVQAHSPAYALAAPIASGVEQALDSVGSIERLVDHFIHWTEESDRDLPELLDAAPAIVTVIQAAFRSGRWASAAQLAGAVEGVLASGGRWDAWESTLQVGLDAARAMGDLDRQGRFLHQLGSRALCLGESTVAEERLMAALAIRESLGDERGAAATRHNLDVLRGGPPPSGPASERGPVSPTRPGLWLVASVVAVMAALVVAGIWAAASGRPFQKPTPTPAVVLPLQSQILTATPTTATTTPRSTKTTAPTTPPTTPPGTPPPTTPPGTTPPTTPPGTTPPTTPPTTAPRTIRPRTASPVTTPPVSHPS